MGLAVPELILSRYGGTNTVADRIDPRTKLLYVLWMFLMTIVVYDPVLQMVMVATVVVAMILGRINPSKLLKAGRLGVYVGFASLVLWVLFRSDEGDTLFGVFGFPVTDAGLLTGMSVALRIVCVLFSFLLVSMTTPARSIITALSRLRVPRVFAMAIGIVLRLVPQLQAEHVVIMEAQRARGIEFDKGGPISRLRKHSSYVIPLVIRAMKIVRDMSIAMDARAYDPYAPRTLQPQMQYHTIDRVILIVLPIIFAGCVVARLFGYGGPV
jgi:energy-coupling factor transport system permease protein